MQIQVQLHNNSQIPIVTGLTIEDRLILNYCPMKKQHSSLNTYFTCVVVLAVIIPLQGISQIQGAVKDSLNQPVPFANVFLLDQSDSTLVSIVVASEEGTYSFTSFKPGWYIIGTRLLGYQSAFSAPFEVKPGLEHYHIEPVIMTTENHNIQDVHVVAKKPLYEMQIDRMVVNVENSITASGNTALQILEKSPGVIVSRQNNSITMAGKSGVRVIINGKQSRIPIEAAVQMLDGMSADNVKRIELITTPPAKYDADGDAGIINIVLKKNEDFGTNGSFTLGAGVAEREKMNGSFNINHHVDRVNYFATYSATYNNSRNYPYTYRRSMDKGVVVETEADHKGAELFMFHNLQMGMDYTLSSKTALSLLVTGFTRNWEADATSYIQYSRNQVPERRTEMESDERNQWLHGMGNINLKHNFTEEAVLDFNVDYLNYYNSNPSDYKIAHLIADNQELPGENIDVRKKTPIDILVATLDYSNQFTPAIKLEAGVKGTMTLFENNVGVRFFNEGAWSYDPELTGHYKMNESIGAAFLSLSLNITKGTKLNGGFRYEYMNTVLDSETEKGIIDLEYGRLFPTLYFSQKLFNSHTFQISYSRRIDRPTFNELAPFVILITPETFLSGNENLLPAFSNIIKADYQVKSVILTVSHTATSNAIARFQPRLSDDGTREFITSRNLDHTNTLSIVLAVPVTLTSWWKMQNNLTWLQYNVTTGYEGIVLDMTRDYYQFNSSHSITFSKSISGEISGFYRSKYMAGIAGLKPLGRIDAGVQWKVSENSRFNLNMTDVFNTFIIRATTDVPELNLYSYARLNFETQVYRLTFTHNFGNTALKVKKRNTASEEEKQRVTE